MSALKATAAVLLVLASLQNGCRKPAPPPPKPAPQKPPPKVFAYTQTNEVVEAETIPFKKGMDIIADFNADGRKDMAVVIRKPQSNEIVIYVSQTLGRYFLGGKIVRTSEGDVKGLLVREGETHTDLAIVIRNKNGSTQVVQYKNTGVTFEEVPDPFIAPTTP